MLLSTVWKNGYALSQALVQGYISKLVATLHEHKTSGTKGYVLIVDYYLAPFNAGNPYVTCCTLKDNISIPPQNYWHFNSALLEIS